ncbi:MAG: hypothetical protein KAG64_01535 [Bacteroidales bacterium]|nr:hypothetical protein [Bacteroidales bacterium]
MPSNFALAVRLSNFRNAMKEIVSRRDALLPSCQRPASVQFFKHEAKRNAWKITRPDVGNALPIKKPHNPEIVGP